MLVVIVPMVALVELSVVIVPDVAVKATETERLATDEFVKFNAPAVKLVTDKLSILALVADRLVRQVLHTLKIGE